MDGLVCTEVWCKAVHGRTEWPDTCGKKVCQKGRFWKKASASALKIDAVHTVCQITRLHVLM